MKKRSEGCPRCRLDKIKFTREVRLPRFTMHEGETWELPQVRYLPDGSAELGGGILPKDSFIVEVEDDSRACGCNCGSSSPRACP